MQDSFHEIYSMSLFLEAPLDRYLFFIDIYNNNNKHKYQQQQTQEQQHTNKKTTATSTNTNNNSSNLTYITTTNNITNKVNEALSAVGPINTSSR